MLILNTEEMDGLRGLATRKRRGRLKHTFLHEIEGSDISLDQLSDFFDKGFDQMLRLPALRDDELLNLCRIGYKKRTHVRGLEEFRRCEKEHQWPGRALYLNSAFEMMTVKDDITPSSPD